MKPRELMADELKAAEDRGQKKGEIRGEIHGEIKTIYSLFHDGLLDINVASRRLNMTLEEFKEGFNAASFS